MWRHLPAGQDAGTVLHLLLDDLPGGMIIGGFTRHVEEAELARSAPGPVSEPGRPLDVCAGWAAESRAARELDRTGSPPPPATRPAPSLVSPEDATGWHTVPALPRFGIGRRRRLDVVLDGPDILVEAMFRDSFLDADGGEQVLHEYVVHATVDGVDGTLREIRAEPHVLPHEECPVAAVSVRALRGAPVSSLRDRVSAELFGPTTCTHLNDVVRGLADVPALVGIP